MKGKPSTTLLTTYPKLFSFFLVFGVLTLLLGLSPGAVHASGCVNLTYSSTTTLSQNVNNAGCWVIVNSGVNLTLNNYNVTAKGLLVNGTLIFTSPTYDVLSTQSFYNPAHSDINVSTLVNYGTVYWQDPTLNISTIQNYGDINDTLVTAGYVSCTSVPITFPNSYAGSGGGGGGSSGYVGSGGAGRVGLIITSWNFQNFGTIFDKGMNGIPTSFNYCNPLQASGGNTLATGGPMPNGNGSTPSNRLLNFTENYSYLDSGGGGWGLNNIGAGSGGAIVELKIPKGSIIGNINVTGGLGVNGGGRGGNGQVFVFYRPSYSFYSEFSYISPSNIAPSCSFLYGYQPTLLINNETIATSSAQHNHFLYNSINNPSSKYYPMMSLLPVIETQAVENVVDPASYMNITLLSDFTKNITFMRSNLTVQVNTTTLSYPNAYFSQLTTTNAGQEVHYNVSGLNWNQYFSQYVLEPTPDWPEVYGPYKIPVTLVSTNSTVYYPLKMSINFTIPTQLLSNNIDINSLNLSINALGSWLSLTNTSLAANGLNGYLGNDIADINHVNYTLNGTVLRIPLNGITAQIRNDPLNGKVFSFVLPLTVYVEANTKGIPTGTLIKTQKEYGEVNGTVNYNDVLQNGSIGSVGMGFRIEIVGLQYSTTSDLFSFSPPGVSTPFNATVLSNGYIVSTTGTHNYNTTFLSTNTTPFFHWTFSSNGELPIDFVSYLNRIDFTASTVFEILGKNYTTATAPLEVYLNGSTMYNVKEFFYFNNVAEKINFNFTTNAFNPCFPHQLAQGVDHLINISTNGTILQQTCGTGVYANKSCIGGISGISGRETPPISLKDIILNYAKTWGFFFGSLLLLGVIAFEFGMDKKGRENPQVIFVGIAIALGVNLFSLAIGYGNTYVAGGMIVILALLMVFAAQKVLHPDSRR